MKSKDYVTQERDPYLYSNNRPTKITTMNDKIIVAEKSVGTIKEISTSKTIKRMAIKKNFIQKGTWLTEVGSKPHSYDETSSSEREEERGRKVRESSSRTRVRQKKK